MISADSKIVVAVFLSVALVWVLMSRRAQLEANLAASLLVIGLLVGTFSTEAWRTSLEAALVPIVAIVLFVMVSATGLEKRWLTAVVVGSASLLALLAVRNLFGEASFWYELISAVSPSSTLIERMPVALPRAGVGALHPNETAMIGALAIPLAIVGRRRFAEFSVFWALCLVLLVAMVVATGSRGGALSAVVGALLTLWILRSTDAASRQRWRLAVWAALGLTAMGILFLALSDYRPDFIFRGTVGDRYPVWAAGWQMFMDRPFTGNGPGAFSWLASEYLGPTYPGVGARRIWHEAHNGYIQLFAEVGVVGVVVVGAGLWMVFRRACRSLRADGFERSYCAAALGGLTAFGIHSIVEASTAALSPIVFIAVVVGGLFSRPMGGASDSHSGPIVTFSAMLIGLPLVALLLTLPAQVDYERGVSASWRGEWRDAAIYFDHAAAMDPYPIYERSATVAWSYAGEPDIDRTMAAASLVPFDPSAFLNAALVSPSAEVETLLASESHRLAGDEIALIVAGYLYSDVGNSEEAHEAYSSSIAVNAWLGGSEVWSELRLSESETRRLVASAIALRTCGVSEVQFLLGQQLAPFEDLILDSCGDTSRAVLALRMQMGLTSALESVIEDRVSRVPDDVGMRRIAAIGRTGPAGNRQLAIAGLLGDPWSALELARRTGTHGLDPAVRSLLVRNYLGHTPMVLSADQPSAYRFAAIRNRIIYRRSELPTMLFDGPWVKASSPVHAEIVGILSD